MSQVELKERDLNRMAGEEKTPWPQRQVTKLADANWVDVTMWDELAPYIPEGDIVVNCLRSQAQRGWYKWSSKCSTTGKKPYLHRTTPSTMRCHGSKDTHPANRQPACKTQSIPAPASSNHIWSSMPSCSTPRSGTCVSSAMGEIVRWALTTITWAASRITERLPREASMY